MSYFHPTAFQQYPQTIRTEKLELIWQMGLASLIETDNELRLPSSVSDDLSNREINFLETRLSNHLGAPTVSFKDLSMDVYRILRMPEMQKPTSTPSTSMSPPNSSSSASSPVGKSKVISSQNRQYGKKAKIPRPPNAFILYRQKHHPVIKAQNPELRNNDISVILGHQWKTEDEAIRGKFKELADELKRQHYLKFPDYQYAPRKPSEKKRRMTTKKLARMQDSEADHDASDFPVRNVPNACQNISAAPRNTTNTASQVSFDSMPSFDDMLGFNNQQTPLNGPYASSNEMNNELDTILPQQPINTSLVSDLDTTQMTPTNSTAFLHSLIDWDAIQEGQQWVKYSVTKDESGEVAQIQNDHPHFNTLGNHERNAFDEELERTLSLLE